MDRFVRLGCMVALAALAGSAPARAWALGAESDSRRPLIWTPEQGKGVSQVRARSWRVLIAGPGPAEQVKATRASNSLGGHVRVHAVTDTVERAAAELPKLSEALHDHEVPLVLFKLQMPPDDSSLADWSAASTLVRAMQDHPALRERAVTVGHTEAAEQFSGLGLSLHESRRVVLDSGVDLIIATHSLESYLADAVNVVLTQRDSY